MEKTITDKLNLQKYKDIAILGLPEGADDFKELSDYDTELCGASYDLIFAFVLDLGSLKALLAKIIKDGYLNKEGYVYFAYPKKGNKVYDTFIHRDELMSGIGADDNGYVLNSTIKFSKMVGLDEVFTVVGLKEDSRGKGKKTAKSSQKVDDYLDIIPEIEKDLRDAPDGLAFYKSLTPGYQKDWARYVYSAKQEATRQKRREEMKEILRAGYKSRDLYRRDR